MQWYDPRLMWDKDQNGMVQTIRARLDEVWTPELLIVNRIHDFPKVDENVPKCKTIFLNEAQKAEFSVKVNHDGRVVYTRLFRMRAGIETDLTTHKTLK